MEKDVCEKTLKGGAFILYLAFCLRAGGESILGGREMNNLSKGVFVLETQQVNLKI